MTGREERIRRFQNHLNNCLDEFKKACNELIEAEIQEKNKKVNDLLGPSKDMDKLMNSTDLSTYLKVHPSTIRIWIMKDRIPCHRLPSNSGKKPVRFYKEEIDAWVKGEKLRKSKLST